MGKSDHVKEALDTFENSFNCAQAVFSSLSAELGLDRETSLKIASCFGGGMRCGEVCGAVTGALMAIGLKYGFYKTGDIQAKMKANEKAVEFIRQFKEKNRSILCRELLGYNLSKPEDMKKIQEKALFQTVCPKMVAEAVEIAERVIKDNR